MVKIDERLLDVNEYGVLRVPVVLWLSVVFLCRYIFLWFIAFVWLQSSVGLAQLLGAESMWLLCLCELPALLVFCLFFLRRPGGGRIVRLMWMHGSKLCMLSAISNMIISVIVLWQSSYWGLWPELFVASWVLVDSAILLAFIRSEYLKRVFDEFPA